MRDYSSSLKFLRESLRLCLAYFLCSCERLSRPIKPEVSLETHFLAFFVLWKLGNYREALMYIKLCTQSINDINRYRHSVLSQKSRLNLVGLIAMSLSACIAKNEGDTTLGVDILTQCLSQMAKIDVEAKPLMARFRDKLRDYGNSPAESSASSIGECSDGIRTPDYAMPMLPVEYMQQLATKAMGFPVDEDRPADLLVTHEFETLFFITNLMAHIDPSTPLIRESELELAAAQQHSTFLPKPLKNSKASSKLFPQHKDLPIVHNPGYLRLFATIRNKGKADGGRSDESMRAQKTTARDRAFSNRPHGRSDSEGSAEIYAEMRTRSVPPKSRIAYLSPTLNQTRVLPSITVLRDIERSKASLLRARNNVELMQQEATARRRWKHNIMVEFSPRAAAADVEISLHPLPNSAINTPEIASGRMRLRGKRRNEGED